MGGFGNYPFGLVIPSKPKVFVSYHHENDQQWYDQFIRLFSDAYQIFTDTSLERRIDSEDTDYTRRRIREENIAGSSLTIVLCGADTWGRRWVDSEIQMTLNKQHGLLGIILPTNQNRYVPQRLHDNILSGFAHCIQWATNPTELSSAIQIAKNLAAQTSKIDNTRESMWRSRT